MPGAQRGLKVRTGLIRTRNPGAALVEEARRARPRSSTSTRRTRRRRSARSGPTASYLLRKRPCRVVIVELEPSANGHQALAVAPVAGQLGARGRAAADRQDVDAAVLLGGAHDARPA